MTLLEAVQPYLSLNTPWRKKAWEKLLQMGLPTRKWDPFKYVSLKGLVEGEFVPTSPLFPKIEGGLSLTEAMQKYSALLQKRYTEALEGEKNPFALLNQALAEEGQFLYVPPGKKMKLEWELILEGGLRAPKVEIFVGKGGALTLSWKCLGKESYFYNPSLQITLDEGAHAKIERHNEHSSEAYAMETVRARLKRDAHLSFFVFSKGAKSERHDLEVSLMGENSAADLKGLSLPSGKNEIHQFITMKHLAPHTRSNQHFKTAAQDQGRASFEGKIYVEKEAQKTEAYQLNNNLLLSSEAKAMSKPNLEIFADDVKASHGATVSQPKEEELFYLQTRGLTKQEAKRHLVRGFCRELLDRDV
jgi:Fe-S cluster assembly protein SufD